MYKILSNLYNIKDVIRMKRFYYQGNDFVDELNRIWKLSYFNGCPKWDLTNEVVQLPEDFEYIEYIPQYSL